MATLQEQNVEIERHLFDKVQKLVQDSDVKYTELSLNGKASENELGLINPEIEYLDRSDGRYNGTLQMKQTLSNRYINDYSLYKVDYDSFQDGECPETGLNNCDGYRFLDAPQVVIENSLRTPILGRDGDGNEYIVSNNTKNIDYSSNDVDNSFNEMNRTKKSCKNDDEKVYPDIFDIQVPVVLDDRLLKYGIDVNSREAVREMVNQNRAY